MQSLNDTGQKRSNFLFNPQLLVSTFLVIVTAVVVVVFLMQSVSTYILKG